jgi:hypothetical protein
MKQMGQKNKNKCSLASIMYCRELNLIRMMLSRGIVSNLIVTAHKNSKNCELECWWDRVVEINMETKPAVDVPFLYSSNIKNASNMAWWSIWSIDIDHFIAYGEIWKVWRIDWSIRFNTKLWLKPHWLCVLNINTKVFWEFRGAVPWSK